MLVLSRQRTEEVVIEVPPSATPTRVIVSTQEIRRDKVRIGFIAPKEVLLHRREVMNEIDRERATASTSEEESK